MAAFLKSAAVRQLRQALDWHLANISDDAELLMRMEGMATQPAFGGMGWYWGPKLWARSRARFRPFVLQHLSDFGQREEFGQRQFERLAWQGEVAAALDPWLAQAERDNDLVLFRRLYAWKHPGKNGWGLDTQRWQQDLCAGLAAARSPAERGAVLARYDMPATLDEAGALRLYGLDAALARPFILKHLPHRGWGIQQDKRWPRLAAQAREQGDADFAEQLDRRLISLAKWREQALALARSGLDGPALCEALRRSHPKDLWEDFGPVFVELLKLRGAELLPYVEGHLRDVAARGWLRDSALALADLAQARGWVDFRIAVLVACARPPAWNAGLLACLNDPGLSEPERRRRLALFSGVSREWNGLGWGLAQVQQLEEPVALRLYESQPELLRSQFKAHLTPAWDVSYLSLFERAWAQGDEELCDHLAARYATRGQWGRADAKEQAPAERVADLLSALKLEPAAFARRAAAILTRIPAYAIPNYANLMRQNRLARLLFERSAAEFLADAGAVRELVEASEIHVQRLAYRVLGLRDDAARAQAADALDILLGTLLRPLHRDTRRQAFTALKNAAHAEPGARRVLARAREAFALPDRRYPKEGLLDLVAHILHRHPGLALEGETPTVYRHARAS